MKTIFDELYVEGKSISITLPPEIINSEDYILVDIMDNDNLMTLAHRYIGSKELWYVIYLFNNMKSQTLTINNAIPSKFLKVMRGWLEYEGNISDILTHDDKYILVNNLMKYFQEVEKMSVIDSFTATNDIFHTKPKVVIDRIINTIEETITEELVKYKIKIPRSNVITEINRHISLYKKKEKKV